jgi:predicted aspartyl protease
MNRLLPIRMMGAPLERPRFQLGPFRTRLHHRLGVSVDELREEGALLEVTVGQAKDVADSLRSQGKTVPDAVSAMAMIDTGASITAIDQDLAQSLGLVQTGVAPIAGVTGVQNQPIYAANLGLARPSVALDPWKMIGSPLKIQNFQVLLGRDFLEQLTLVYDGSSGNFTLSPGGGPGAQAPQGGGGASTGVKVLGTVLGAGGLFTALGFATRLIKT